MKTPRVLVVDDDGEMAATIADGLIDAGYDAVPCASSAKARTMLERERFDALVTDVRMPEIDGLELLAIAKRLDATRPVLVMTAYAAVDNAVEAIRRGAQHYLVKPFKLDELSLFLGRALDEAAVRGDVQALRKTFGERFGKHRVVAESDAMKRVLDVLARVAPSDAPVLFTGETGTGKSLLARTLHHESARSAGRFVTVNCAALPEQLLESELFGHVKGAFSGATNAKVGLFDEADGGTLFLDEVGDIAVPLQGKLLDVLERGVIRAVGATREHAVDVRVIAATNRDLRARVRDGSFRDDLLYRLEVIPLRVPALRERREDVPPLVDALVATMREKHPRSPVRRIAPAALRALFDHPWPGNVRELAHVIERLFLLGSSEEATLAEVPLLPAESKSKREPEGVFTGDVQPIRDVQRRYAAWALEQCGGNRTRTAERLGIDVKTLAKWLDEGAA